MTFPDFLVNQPDGEIVLAGHRITIVNVLDSYNDGDSVEMIAAKFPTVALATLHKVVAFYLENRAELDAYLKQYHADLDAARATAHFTPSVAELRRRLAERRAAEARPQSA
jgi:uncharacterized protein (DUF433 family)